MKRYVVHEYCTNSTLVIPREPTNASRFMCFQSPLGAPLLHRHSKISRKMFRASITRECTFVIQSSKLQSRLRTDPTKSWWEKFGVLTIMTSRSFSFLNSWHVVFGLLFLLCTFKFYSP